MNKLTFKAFFFLVLLQLNPNQTFAQASSVCSSVEAGQNVTICSGQRYYQQL